MQKDYINEMVCYLKKIYGKEWYWVLKNLEELSEIEKKYPDAKQILARNTEFKDIHRGKRCFVLGNGPSLNDIDFKLLENEIVFTVNRLNLHPNFEKLKSNYHVIIDLGAFKPVRWQGNRGFTKYAMDQMRALRSQKDLIVFMPLAAKDIIEKEKLDRILDIRYLGFMERKFIDGFKTNDMTRIFPKFDAVVPSAVLCATYMGFKEIYLLGCDETIIKDEIHVALGEKCTNTHAYTESDERYRNMYIYENKDSGIEHLIEMEMEKLKSFRELYKWCRKNKIKLFNLSSTTLIESIPRRNFKDII